ncbi:hypothetical protein FRB90_000459 [Tulasnella sp. 427]|nr:hypothetical protein FRB90_000459 [Tulasnella sp. 427]
MSVLQGGQILAKRTSTSNLLYQSVDNEISDVFDSTHYKALCKTQVEIKGVRMSHQLFDSPTDVALGQSMDGVALFERSKNRCTATPIITVNYNLPPEIRAHSSNVLINAIIPGPHGPKDVDSFMFPMYKESHRLAEGVRMDNIFVKSSFTFRAYWIRVFGDMLAMMEMMEIKGHMGVRHCRRCLISGTTGNGTTYYSPLAQPRDPNSEESNPLVSWNPRALEMRIHQQVLSALDDISKARNKTEKERLQTIWGLTGKPSYIFRFPGADFVASTPYDFMHMMLSNNTKNYTKILQGKFNKFDSGTGNYIIPPATWIEIGVELVKANRTIPSAFVSYLPDIWKERSSYTAELYSFWIVYAAPILLHGRLPSPYYEHLVKFGKIIKFCLKFTITTEELETLEELCISWVEEYEKLYYQYNASRVAFCTSNIHGVLHIPEDIRRSGPLWTAWAFIMERICSLTVRAVKSRLNPFGSLNQYFKRVAQLTHIRNKYNLSSQLEPLDEAGEASDEESDADWQDEDLASGTLPPVKLTRFEEQVQGYGVLKPSTLERPDDYRTSPSEERLGTKCEYSTENCEVFRYSVQPQVLVSHCDPSFATMERWCKFGIDGGDSVRGSEAMKPEQNIRDSSFVRFELAKRNGNRAVLYGQFHYAVVLSLNPVNIPGRLSIPTRKTFILAFITPTKRAALTRRRRWLRSLIVMRKHLSSLTCGLFKLL